MGRQKDVSKLAISWKNMPILVGSAAMARYLRRLVPHSFTDDPPKASPGHDDLGAAKAVVACCVACAVLWFVVGLILVL